MVLNTCFTNFLSKIRPTQAQTQSLQKAHRLLKERMIGDDYLGPRIISVFLQGSYRRSTAIRPQGYDKLDVDMVVVTRFRREDYPVADDVMDEFTTFLNKHYKGKWKRKGRSLGIELSNLKLDIVIAADPSEEAIWETDFAKGYSTLDDLSNTMVPIPDSLLEFLKTENGDPAWKLEPLYIPDSDSHQWQRTHPLEQYRWTTNKNGRTNGHYVNIVKLVKWWWRTAHPDQEYPKSYPLEHLIGDCCPDAIESLAVGFTTVLEEMVSRFSADAEAGIVPFVPDRGVPEHDILKRLSSDDFYQFIRKVQEASMIAKDALESDDETESAARWRELFGDRFPDPPNSSSSAATATKTRKDAFTPRTEPTRIGGGRFA